MDEIHKERNKLLMSHRNEDYLQFNEFYVVGKYQSQGIKIPKEKRNSRSGAYELRAAEDVTLQPFGQEPTLVHTGLKANMPDSNLLMVYDHHLNLVKHYMTMIPGTMTFSNTYFENDDNEGEICAYFQNMANHPVIIHKGEIIMEAIFIKTYDATSRDVWRSF